MKGSLTARRSHSRFAAAKHGDLIPETQALNLLRTKSSAQHELIDCCILSRTNCIQRKIKVKGQMLGTVTRFKYLGAVVSHHGSKPEVL